MAKEYVKRRLWTELSKHVHSWGDGSQTNEGTEKELLKIKENYVTYG